MNKKIIWGVVILLALTSVVVFYVQKDSLSQKNQEYIKNFNQEKQEAVTHSKFAYEPKTTKLPLVPTPYGGFKTYISPDGNYIAWSYSNEGGDSGIYITDLKENKLSNVYCGFFHSWSEDSKQIEIYVPVECGLPSGISSTSFHLTVEGDVIVDK